MKGPKGKYLFGTVKVGERGQIVIPKEARDVFDIKPGDMLLLLGDEKKGIAIIKDNEIFKKFEGMLSSQKEDEEEEYE